MTEPRQRARDRRVQRTRTLLRDALTSLIHEKSYEAIGVQEIIDRANVGRSSFYTHFRDKDELLESGIHDMLGPLRATGLSAGSGPFDRLLSFSPAILEYVDGHRGASADRMGATGRTILHQHLRRVLTDVIADDIRRDLEHRPTWQRTMPAELLARYVAATFVLVLSWWLERASGLSAAEVDDLFRTLVLPTLAATSW